METFKCFYVFFCIAPLTLVVMILRGLTFHPCAQIVFINGLYLSCLVLMAWLVAMSCVNVNFMICMVRSNEGMNGPV